MVAALMHGSEELLGGADAQLPWQAVAAEAGLDSF
jgi:hypothetical protein